MNEFKRFSLNSFFGDDKAFERLMNRLLEPMFIVELPIIRYTNTIGTDLDRKGVDLQLIFKNDLYLNIDHTMNRGHKALRVWNKRGHLKADRVKTQCVLDIPLLEAYQSGKINARQLLSKGIALWEEIRDLVLEGNFAAVEQYAEQHS